MKIKPLLAFTFLLTACATSQTQICGDRIQFVSPQKISLNKNEALLACGDSELESWKTIPLSQAEFHIKAFLSERAYYYPKFSYHDEKLYVDPGKQLIATALLYEGEPEHFQDIHLRKIVGYPLNTELLNTVDSWAQQRLRNMGYACPTVKVQAIEETGEIHVTLKPGPLYTFSKAKLVDLIGLYPEAIHRFDAYTEGDPYHYDWLKLTENRAENDGMVVSSQFVGQCPQKTSELELSQRVIGGTKHLVTIGAGASTEEIPIAEATWKSVRLDENGSSLSVNLYGSQRIQSATTTYSYYAFKNAPRTHWAPTFSFERDNERTFLSSTFKASAPLSYQADYQESSLILSAGPALQRDFSTEFGIEKAITLSSLIGDLNFITHNFELFQGDPRSGSNLEFNIEILSNGIQIDPLGTVLKLTGTHLIPLNHVFPPQCILGFRYAAVTTITDQRPNLNTILPAQYFHTLGGDQNLRGFGRDELAPNGLGGLTSLYFGTEFRFAKTFPAGIEPFSFFDLGYLGVEPLRVDPALYYSPGLGIRWSTPFGAIRSTLAHGFISPSPGPDSPTEHYQFFLSFGKEF